MPNPKYRKLLWNGGGGLGSTILGLGPLAYWPLNETAGLTAANYGSLGAGANGTYTGVTLAQMAAPGGGMAPYFDAAADYVNIFTAALVGAFNGRSLTVMGWSKVFNVLVWADGAPRVCIYLISDANNRVRILKNAVVNTFSYIYTANSVTNQADVITNTTSWIFSAITVDDITANEFKAYHNGAQTGATLAPDTWAGALTGAVIGAQTIVPALPWSGYLSHFAVFNKALTPTQIAAIYAAGRT